MQSSEIVSQAGVLTLHSSHIGFADNLVALWNELRINWIPIGDPEVTSPVLNALS
jgi:hypothetical protein